MWSLLFQQLGREELMVAQGSRVEGTVLIVSWKDYSKAAITTWVVRIWSSVVMCEGCLSSLPHSNRADSPGTPSLYPTPDKAQWWAGKCLTSGSPGGRNSWYTAFSDFLGVNTPMMANFRISLWRRSWKEMHKIDSWKYVQTTSSTPLTRSNLLHVQSQPKCHQPTKLVESIDILWLQNTNTVKMKQKREIYWKESEIYHGIQGRAECLGRAWDIKSSNLGDFRVLPYHDLAPLLSFWL